MCAYLLGNKADLLSRMFLKSLLLSAAHALIILFFTETLLYQLLDKERSLE